MSDETGSRSDRPGPDSPSGWARWARLWRESGFAPGARQEGKHEVDPAAVLRLFPRLAGQLPAGGGDFLVAESSPAAEAPRLRPTGTGLALVTVCTANHLHYARTMVRSFLAHHPEATACVVVADAELGEILEVPGARVVSGREVAPRDLHYLALKLDACNLCCALKPFALLAELERGRADRILYLDADLLVLARFDALIERLLDHDFVLTPHLLAPYEFRDRVWQRPSMGDIAAAGFFNGGILGLRTGEAALRFLVEWRTLVSTPGAFDPQLGPQHEQNSLNFVTSFADRVAVLRDPTYNVAYWNLHERGVRWGGLDGPEASRWSVEGRPLTCFHFSGFRWQDRTRLSRHDSRFRLFQLPSVAALVDHYWRELALSGAGEIWAEPYRFGRLPSGIELDDRLRTVFVEHERALRRDLDPWTAEGESYYCQAALSPVPHATGLLPALLDRVLRERADLRGGFAHARVRPQPALRWFYDHGVREYGWTQLLDTHRPVSVSAAGAHALGGALVYLPRAFAGLERPLGADRSRLVARLTAGGHEALVRAVASGEVEHWRLSTMATIRRIVEERSDLRDAYPDLLDEDAGAFGEWLAAEGTWRYGLPADSAATFVDRSRGRALARVFSFVARSPYLQAQFPLALVGENHDGLIAALMDLLAYGFEFDLEDLVSFQWLMDEKPWSGVPLLFELAEHSRKQPSPLLDEGQRAILAPLLARDVRFAEELERYRERHRSDARRRHQAYVRNLERIERGPSGSVLRRVEPGGLVRAAEHEGVAFRARQAAAEAGLRVQSGVNLFGYGRSAIGLGTMTRGLVSALSRGGVPVAEQITGSVGLDRDLGPDDFVAKYDPELDTNLFVSYPHLEEDLLALLPEHARGGRKNIVYLAWEQRDAHPWWRSIYSQYDQVWALSEFAARHLATHLEREVTTMPCALDFEAFPRPAGKEEVGLDGRDFVFLYNFDAASSIERKNPEAAIAAFRIAFRPDERVRLLLRVANGERNETRDRLRRVVAAARGDQRIEFRFDRLSREGALRVISAVDAVVSLHRAEGFGFLCAEAMAYARPVVATGYSGNLQFMTPENSFLVAAREVEVRAGEGPFQLGSIWAEPDVEQAATLMRRLYEERELGREVGRRGQREVRETLSIEAASRRALAALGLDSRARPQARASIAIGTTAS